MKNIYLTLLMAVASLAAAAQVVTTSPAIIQPNSQNIVITFHADQGNRGLVDVSSSTPVYAHTGVIFKNSDQWSNAPSWGDNADKYRLAYVSPNTWTLTIPSIATYYGLSEAQVKNVAKLAFVFRTGDNSREAKDADGSDIFVDVAPEGFAMQMTYTPKATMLSEATDVTFTVNTTSPATISLYDGPATGTPIAMVTTTTSFTKVYNISKKGVTTITAKAVAANGEEKLATATFTFVGKSTRKDYPGSKPQMGQVENADGSVTFCLAAPYKESVMIMGDWNDFAITPDQMMYYQNVNGIPYFWITIPGIADGTDHVYYFVVDNSIVVADPYARLILDPSNDKWIPSSVYPDMPPYPANLKSHSPVAVYNSAMADYDWKVKNFKRPDPSSLIIYELLIRDFTGTEGEARGEGTIAGVLGKLDYLKKLGVNAVELLPIMEFNGNNSWGYNTNFYFAPDKAYGTPDDYRLLIDECHKRGMAVILDIVFNQTDGLHPWYMMYPIDKNTFYNGSAPHSYSVLNDWNQDNPLVQQQFKDAVKFWLTEYNVDGYRFDLVKGLGTNESYKAKYNEATNTWSDVTEAKTNDYNASRVARMKELHDAMREVDPTAYFINENLAGAREENEMAEDGELNWANINHAACNFAAGTQDGSNLNRFYAPLDSRIWGSTVSYAVSHDEERPAYYVSKYGVNGVKGNRRNTMRRLGSLAAQMLMMPGAHMIWQFEEFGADQTTKQSDGGNDTSPKKVVWSLLDNTNNAGLLQSYKELCNLRLMNPELFIQDLGTLTINCSDKDWSLGRTVTLKNGDKALYLVVNPQTNATIGVTLNGAPANADLKLMSCTAGTTPKKSGNTVTLSGGCYAIYGTQNLAGITSVTPDDNTAKAYGGNGRIIIVGQYDNAEAYTITGRTVDINSNLTPGFYVVRIDGRSSKVVVR